MTLPRELQTDRLHLRRWLPSDRAPFAALNADPRVMEHFPAALSREDSENLAAQIDAHFEEHGFGLWAIDIPSITPFAGFGLLARERARAANGQVPVLRCPSRRDVYIRAFDASVTLLVAGYDYSGIWAFSTGGTFTRRNGS